MPLKAKITSLCLVLLLALVASGVGDAGARKHKKKRAKPAVAMSTQITLSSVNADGASGSISSGGPACLGDRLVTLYQENSGPSVPSSVQVATTRTRADGSWSATGSAVVGGWLYPGQYFAAVQPKQTRRFNCQPASSNEKYF
jgi:hypothetical protein